MPDQIPLILLEICASRIATVSLRGRWRGVCRTLALCNGEQDSLDNAQNTIQAVFTLNTPINAPFPIGGPMRDTGSGFYQGVEFKACAICKDIKVGCNDPSYMMPVVGQTVAGEDILGCGHVKPKGKPARVAEGRVAIAIAPPPESTL